MDAYVALLEYTQDSGLILGMYMFFDELLSLDNDTLEEMMTWLSGKVFDDELGYYATSVYIYEFYYDVCDESTSSLCNALYYYWVVAMSLNIFVSLPVAGSSTWYYMGMDVVEDYETITGWL
jgi:hypothetical protein